MDKERKENGTNEANVQSETEKQMAGHWKIDRLIVKKKNAMESAKRRHYQAKSTSAFNITVEKNPNYIY